MTTRFDELFGFARLTVPPFVFGEQPKGATVERFDKDGHLVERRVVPPVIRILYDE